jgi:hypothetical protein
MVRALHAPFDFARTFMPDSESSSLTLLLFSICGLLLLIILCLLARVLSRLKAMERQLEQVPMRLGRAPVLPPHAETSPSGAFEVFLAEDPERRNLPRGEQSSAYRQWRQEKGMNWTNS